MKVINDKIALKELKNTAQKIFGDLVKSVVDIEKEIMVIDAGLHSDEEKLLLENGSKQENLWGINLYPNLPRNQMIEFDSMINLRPTQNNRSRGVDDPKIREKITEIVNKLIDYDKTS